MISPFSPRPTIEPLEARIAPALLVNGANLLGAGSPSTGEMSLGGDAVTLVKVISGQAIVWFQDGEISSISIGHNTNLEITGDIYGAIVGNLMPSGRLSDSDNNAANGEDGAVLLPNNLAGLKTLALSSQDGDVPAVVTGGSVANVNVNGKLGGIYAGDGVFHTSSNLVAGGVVALPVGFDFNPVELNTQSVFNITLGNSPAIQPGASVHTVTVQTAKEMQIIAGSGDPDRVDNLAAGSSGGSIQNIKINSALIAGLSGGTTPSYELIAGDGEAGKTGGAGGSIINIFEKASNGTVNIQAGRGGTGNLGIGGAGGSVRALDLQSDGSDYVVRAGDGGFGVSGGAGGSATNNNLANRTPANSLLVAGDFLGNLNDADLSNDVQDGLEDLLVVDSSSGSMVLLQNLNDGASFGKVVQYVNDDLEEVVAITGLGTTPVDAFATDWDGDGDADIVVAYKSSNNLGVFLNDGAGGFYTLDENDEFAVNGFSASLSFSPSAMSPTSSSSTSTSIAVLSTEAGKTTAYYVAKSDAEAVELFGSGTPLKRLANDIAVAKGADGTEYLYVGSQDGSLLQLEPLFDPEGPAFEIIDTLQKVTGGVSNLDASGDGGQLLAFSATGKKIALFDVSSSGALLPQVAPELTGTGRPLVAHFAPNGSGDDSIVVLSSVNAGARLDLFNAVTPDADPLTPDSGFTLAKSFAAQPGLKNFVVVESDGQAGFAAVAGSLSQFYFSTNLADLTKYELPFIGKKVAVSAGRGGDALDLGSVIGKAGSGGGINGINVEASEIRLTSGDGGDSFNGAAGAGGSVSNPPAFLTSAGGTVTPTLIADDVLEISVGDGGTPLGIGSKSASGGNGGALSGVAMTLSSGEIKLNTGNGGAARGGNGGHGGNLQTVTVTSLDGNVRIQTGVGGDAPLGKVKAGDGGSVQNLKVALELSEDIERLENPYFTSISTGAGGNALQGTGGAGGNVSGATLKLDGADRTSAGQAGGGTDAERDSTVSVTVATGLGGSGLAGGAGGSVSGFSSVSVFDQADKGLIKLNYVVLNMTAGAGGNGTGGDGGNGGSIGFAPAGVSGITHYDPHAETPLDNPDRIALRVTAGSGGNGSAKGGSGGAVSNLVAKNSAFVDGASITFTHLASAVIRSGSGGAGGTLDGGKGGDVSGAVIGVQDLADGPFQGVVNGIEPAGGVMHIFSGHGGAGGAAGKGGNAGLITKSTFAAVNVGPVFNDLNPAPVDWPDADLSRNIGVALIGGNGGAGGKSGGVGGTISALQFNTPQLDLGYSAVLFAGTGGAAFGAGATGGAGGSILQISQTKDVNSAVNIVQAGAGGESATGKGGAGGNISAFKTVGFIGRPSFTLRNDAGFVLDQGRLGVFDENGVAQGLFAGRGGEGQIDGLHGAISNISARQIAAIAAAPDANGLFARVSKLTQVTADVIGYDLDQDGIFDTSGAAGASPETTRPVDGFILAAAMKTVNQTRAAFTFVTA